ncbi:hypothetical protein [Mycobacterium sp.]|uniref:SCO3933 family regulatory protein n=1 Tax=Mycobacterium sp. TaxID=1785 RepID=UPI002B992C76|nr:hypothetical protein [Mycobacterium sp.]HTY30589.1 hypothetical protein [Mycobacterium sp.]
MKLKINTNGVSFTCTRTPEQRVNFDTGQPRIDKATGQPLWQVQVMALDESGGDVIAVSVAGEPNVSAGRPVTITGLVALPWSQDGRSGIAYRADAITQTADTPAKNAGTSARP